MATRSRSIVVRAHPQTAWSEERNAPGLWLDLLAKTSHWSNDERHRYSQSASRRLEDLGTTFNVYSDVGGAGQPYEIDPLPLLISREEWQFVADGVAQRMKLLEMVLADWHGPQNSLREGLVPADLVHSNPAYQVNLRHVSPPGGRHLVSAGFDLARDSDGFWRVFHDHAGASGGMGQTLQNRNVVANILPDLLDGFRTAPLTTFFEKERDTIQSLATSRSGAANVVFLTPGFRHPAYFEHAYKARLLGFPLVESADLTVRERRLYLKTLAGLRRIDAVISRVDSSALDPLEFWSTGTGGVPGLIEAWRSGNVTLANAPGASVVSSLALMPFLPEICRKWLGEDLKLKFIETWWLGQSAVRRDVLEHLEDYVLMPAFGHEPLLPLRGSTLSSAARRNWITTIEARPHDFVVQRDIQPSLAPSLSGSRIHDRPVVWRAFALNADDAPCILPGGLGRVGKPGEPPQLWPVHSGFTKDVWVRREDVPAPGNQMTISSVRSNLASAEVPSRIAEQLFWVGRYAERIELVTRLLRVVLRGLGPERADSRGGLLVSSLGLLNGIGLIPRPFPRDPAAVLAKLSALIHDPAEPSGIAILTRLLLTNAAGARDRLSDDTWRFFNRLEDIVHPDSISPIKSDLQRTLDTLILHLAAFAGMEAENMTRGHGWRFLETGRRIERALGGLSLLHTAASRPAELLTMLDPLLETCDSVMTYRRRHFSNPRWEGVVDLLFSDVENPRSFAYQLAILHRELALFPGDPALGHFPQIVASLDVLEESFRLADRPSPAQFKALEQSLEFFSDLLTQHYFSHSVRRVY